MERMVGVRPELVRCAFYVIERVKVLDITIPRYGGLRELEQQEYLVAKGASRTLKSDHLDGYALDVVPYMDGRARWDRVVTRRERGESDDQYRKRRNDAEFVKASYDEIWKLWRQAAEAFEYQFKPKLSWDWPHHSLKR